MVLIPLKRFHRRGRRGEFFSITFFWPSNLDILRRIDDKCRSMIYNSSQYPYTIFWARSEMELWSQNALETVKSGCWVSYRKKIFIGYFLRHLVCYNQENKNGQSLSNNIGASNIIKACNLVLLETYLIKMTNTHIAHISFFL